MIPEGAHDQNEDWTIFFLNQTPANTISPPLESEAPTPSNRHRRTYSRLILNDYQPNNQLLYVLNLVRTKKDDTVPRYIFKYILYYFIYLIIIYYILEVPWLRL